MNLKDVSLQRKRPTKPKEEVMKALHDAVDKNVFIQALELGFIGNS